MNDRPVISEDVEQATVVSYLESKGYLFCHVPNEAKRSKSTAARMLRLGLRKGVPDLLIFEPMGKYHGLAIEMKSLVGKPTCYQKRWIAALREKGWCAYSCKGAEKAITLIELYMEMRI